MNNLAWDWLHRHLFPFDNLESRLSLVNIFGAIFLASLFYFLFSKDHFSFKRLFFRKKYWWNRSTQVDYKIYFINALLKSFILVPTLGMSFYFSKEVFSLLSAFFGGFVSLQGSMLSLGLVSLFMFAWDDWLRFIHHYFMHKIPFLWEFHKVHHSAKILTPITLFRIHPLESAIATVRNSLSLGVSSAMFMFFFSGEVSMYTFFGVNLFGFMFNFLGANLRHSHVPISLGFLEYLFISPKQHQIHHSANPKHFDKNFGVGLAIWDYLAGTLVLSRQEKISHFGVSDLSAHKLADQYFIPFRVPFRKLRHFVLGKKLYTVRSEQQILQPVTSD